MALTASHTIGFCVFAALLLVASQASAQSCVDYTKADSLGKVDSRRITEASGLAASRQFLDVVWTHNDSGDDARLFAIWTDGDTVGRWNIADIDAIDWEDIAYGPCADGDDACLYIADTGNNDYDRDVFTLYRVREPALDTYDEGKIKDMLFGAETFEFTFADAPKSRDIEALAVDPDGTVYLVSKRNKGADLFALPALPEGGTGEDQVLTAEWLADNSDAEWITGADMTADGSRFIMRNDKDAWEIVVPPSGRLEEVFHRTGLEIDLTRERHGEAVAYLPEGDAFLTTAEGKHKRVYWYGCLTSEDEKRDEIAPGTPDDETDSGQAGCVAVPASQSNAPWGAALMLLGVLAMRRTRRR